MFVSFISTPLTLLFMPMFLAQEFHDISPPVNYSLVPTWLIFVAAFVALTIVGSFIWLIAGRLRCAGADGSAPAQSSGPGEITPRTRA